MTSTTSAIHHRGAFILPSGRRDLFSLETRGFRLLLRTGSSDQTRSDPLAHTLVHVGNPLIAQAPFRKPPYRPVRTPSHLCLKELALSSPKNTPPRSSRAPSARVTQLAICWSCWRVVVVLGSGRRRGRERLCRCFGRSGGVPTADLHHSQHGCDPLQRGRGVVRQLLPGSLAFTQRLFF